MLCFVKRLPLSALVVAGALWIHPLLAQDVPLGGGESRDEFKASEAYAQIVADYQRIDATNDAAARGAAGRLVTFAYLHVIDHAKPVEMLDAADLFAVAACYEGLGNLPQAQQLYRDSLAKEPRARTHLALARVHLNDDLQAAGDHFAAAAKLEPAHPNLSQFHLALADAYVRQRNWQEAAKHVEQYRNYVRSLAELQPGNRSAVAIHQAVEKRLTTLRRFVDMMERPAPPVNVQHWIQGEPVDVASLRGKVVVVDFCAMWAAPSRERVSRIRSLHNKYAERGLVALGVTLAYGHRYDPATDTVDVSGNRTPADERADLLLFAEKREIPYRLAVVDRAVFEKFAVQTLPHTVLIDQQGRIRMILLGGDQEDEAELEVAIRELLEIQ